MSALCSDREPLQRLLTEIEQEVISQPLASFYGTPNRDECAANLKFFRQTLSNSRDEARAFARPLCGLSLQDSSWTLTAIMTMQGIVLILAKARLAFTISGSHGTPPLHRSTFIA